MSIPNWTNPSMDDANKLVTEMTDQEKAGREKPHIRPADYPTLTFRQAITGGVWALRFRRQQCGPVMPAEPQEFWSNHSPDRGEE